MKTNTAERIASQSHRRGMSPPEYDYIELDAPVMDTCYGLLNIVTCCMVQTCFSPAIIRVRNRMANRLCRRLSERHRALQKPHIQVRTHHSLGH